MHDQEQESDFEDVGAEFKGAVAQLMKTMQVDIIHSHPY